jgi:hypothetical protein
MVCACFGSSMFAYCSRRYDHFRTTAAPEIFHRRLFLTMKTRITLVTDAQNILPIGADFSELRLAAQGQGQTQDERADNATAPLSRQLPNRRSTAFGQPGFGFGKPHRTS